MKYTHLLYILPVCLSLSSCSSDKKPTDEPQEIKKFNGNYGKTFNDLPEVQFSAAIKNGITPMASRGDTAQLMDKLVRIPKELAYYKTDKLNHSLPYLVPIASELLIKIGVNFRDSLIRKKMPVYKLIVTSLTRTQEDVKKLTKRNGNASPNSAHCYGTSFDISWQRFEAHNPYGKAAPTAQLKFVLGQVLNDLRQQNKCYVKYERKQACFHITVR